MPKRLVSTLMPKVPQAPGRAHRLMQVLGLNHCTGL